MVADTYSLLGLISLEAGNWADWFAGVSSFAAVATALGSYWISEKLRKSERNEIERDSARQIGVKITRVLNATQDFYRHFWTASEKTMVGFTGDIERWRSMNPLIGVHSDPMLALSEAQTNFLLKAKAPELLMEYSMACGRLESIVLAVQEYKVRYEALQSMLPAPSSAEGQIFTHEMTRELALSLHPFSIQVDSIILGIRQLTLDNTKVCLKMMDDIQSVYINQFGKTLFRFEPTGELADVAMLGFERPRI